MTTPKTDSTHDCTQQAGTAMNPSQLRQPAFLINAPFSYSAKVPNNVWMEEYSEAERVPNPTKAMVQFLQLYRNLSAAGLAYVLPTPRTDGLQDLVFTANLGLVLEHVAGRNDVIISNFSSEPRRDETAVGVQFFTSMGYKTHVPETKFEGEADLKHLHDNVYVGGYGLRSESETYDWMERTFDMKVVRLRMTDPYLYHLDCTVFPITRERTLVCTELYEEKEIRKLEQHTDIIDVSADACYSGICNSVRLNSILLNASHLHELEVGTQEYREEIAKNRMLEDIATDCALEVGFLNLSEYLKGGALLSCMVMHLNRASYQFQLL